MEILAKLASVTRLKQVYQTWDVRVMILLSLFLQIFLIFSAPFRKRTSNSFIMVPMWLAYLLADATATFGIGLISSTDLPVSDDTRILHAFWTPFLLLHLGGPDTITAFALEDNELWLRHLLQLGFHTGTCAYILFLAFQENRLLLPTLFVFSAGLIKYAERTRCLFLASSRRFQQTSLGKPDPGSNYDKLVDYFFHMTQANIPTVAKTIAPRRSRLPDRGKEAMPLGDLEVVLYAHRFYRGSKGLVTDLVLNFAERNDSRLFFRNRTPKDAFRVVEVELNFFYDILYTKAVVVHSIYGYALRFASFASSVASFIAFHLIHKRGFHKFDVGVTYSLLVGAIFLESIALVILLLSDWTAVSISGSDDHSLATRVLSKILCVNRKRWPEYRVSPSGWLTRISRRRWCESISQYNLIRYCLNPRSWLWEQSIGAFGLTDVLDEMKYVETVKWNDKLRDFIFKELNMKSELADDLETKKDLYTAKGDWVLRFERHTSLLPWITEVDFDESLLLWHVATELCFQKENSLSEASRGSEEIELRDLAKIFSDYMLYLLLIKSPVMSSVAGIGRVRFGDTCAEVKRFFKEKGKFKPSLYRMDKFQKEACLKILQVQTTYKSGSVKGDSSKSVLFDACILAKELQKLESGKWEIICKVWVEMMCYAACRCKGSIHAQQLGKGGELITLVWMLMSHFGLGNQFQISDFQPRTALTVAK